MPAFKDSNGREWLIEFDGLLLGQVRDECGIDLADPTGAGYVRVLIDSVSLVRVLAILCRESIDRLKITPREFSKGIRGEALEKAYAAVWGAAENFFPPSAWSAMQSHFAGLEEQTRAAVMMRPALALMEPEVRTAAIATMLGAGNFSPFEGESTAANSTAETLSTPASTTPESSEFTPAA